MNYINQENDQDGFAITLVLINHPLTVRPGVKHIHQIYYFLELIINFLIHKKLFE